MPNVVTHCLFGEEVLKKIQNEEILSIVKQYPKEFYIGLNGPDFLFYYNVFPWMEQGIARTVAKYGNLVHSKHVNAFFDTAYSLCQKEKDPIVKNAMESFVLGHLCHWALDSTTHPMIFYRTNGKTKQTRYWHSRLESMMDTLMVDYLRNDVIRNYPTHKYILFDDITIQAISKVYVPILKEVYDIDFNEKMVRKCCKDFHNVLKLLYSPNNTWFHFVQAIESIFGLKWIFTSHMVIGKKDTKYDVLNLKHDTWANPCDELDQHQDSFIDLFENQAMEKACMALDLWKGQNSSKKLLTFLDNRNYETGLSYEKEMIYFKNIYE